MDDKTMDDKTMADKTMAGKRDGKRRGRRRIAWGAAVLFVVYVLSIGPAWRLAWASGSFPSLLTVYRPFLWAAEACHPFANVLFWYLRLWTT